MIRKPGIQERLKIGDLGFLIKKKAKNRHNT